jgi:hypothetical protein
MYFNAGTDEICRQNEDRNERNQCDFTVLARATEGMWLSFIKMREAIGRTLLGIPLWAY